MARAYLIHEKVLDNIISTSYVKTGEQLVDLFTKALKEIELTTYVTS